MTKVSLLGLVNMEDMLSSACKSSRVSSSCSLVLFLINLGNSTCLSRDKHQSRCKIFWSTLQCYNYESQAKPSKILSEESINFTEKKPRFIWYSVIFPLWCFNNYKTQFLYPENECKYLNHNFITLLKEHRRRWVKKYVAGWKSCTEMLHSYPSLALTNGCLQTQQEEMRNVENKQLSQHSYFDFLIQSRASYRGLTIGYRSASSKMKDWLIS